MFNPKSSVRAKLKLVGVIIVTLVSYSLFAMQKERCLTSINEKPLSSLIENSDIEISSGKDKESSIKSDTNFVASSKTELDSVSDTKKKSATVSITSTPPEFPGGDKALLNFINTTMKYPRDAIKKKVEGRVIVSFIIEKDGSIADVKVIRKVDPLLDEEIGRAHV